MNGKPNVLVVMTDQHRADLMTCAGRDLVPTPKIDHFAFAASGCLTSLIGKMHFNDAHNHGFEYYMSIDDWGMYLGPKIRHHADEIANHPLNPHSFDTVDDDGAGFPDVKGLWDGPSPWVGEVRRFPFDDHGIFQKFILFEPAVRVPLKTINLAEKAAMRQTVANLKDQLFAWFDPAANPY
jgi:hypothetical protein